MNKDEIYCRIERAQSGDKDALEEIVCTNSPLIWSIVRRFAGRGHELEDLYQIGSIGLIRATRKFDFSFETAFSTYAVPMIIGEIKRFLRDDGMIKVSRSLKEVATKVRKLAEDMDEHTAISTIASELNISTEEVAEALTASCRPESIYKPVGSSDEKEMLLIDVLKDESNFDEGIIDNLTLNQAAKSLNERDLKLIRLRYFGNKTQSEVASMLGISQVQVSRLEKKILKQLREEIV